MVVVSQDKQQAFSQTAAKLPNFLIIGAYKAGTTALYRYLAQHPDVFMSPIKETNFFALEGEEINYQGPGDYKAPTNRLSVTSWQAYQAQFSGVSHETSLGEASPMYLYSAKARERIRHYLPEVKLIVILRQPAERAFSNFVHLCRDGREKEINFKTAFSQEEQRIASGWAPVWHWQKIGFYCQQLKGYFSDFPRENIKVLLHDDLLARPQQTLQEVYQFIGVDEDFSPNMSRRPNQSRIPKHRLTYALLRRALLSPLATSSQPKLNEMGHMLQHHLTYKPCLDAVTRAEITALYRQDIEELQRLIDRDLSAWLRMSC